MIRLGWMVAALAVIALALPASARSPDLAVGQEWSIKSETPTTAKVIIGRIETAPNGVEIVSVSIVDVPSDRGPTAFGHAPFAKSALAGSLDRLLATGVPVEPEFEEGYAQWKSAGGGYFTVSVVKAIELTLDILRKAHASPPPESPN